MRIKITALMVLIICLTAFLVVGCNEATPITVTFDCNNNSESIVVEVEDESFDMIGDPIRAGYTFGGWFTNENYDQEFVLENYTYDYSVQLFAKWILIKDDETETTYCTVTFDCGEGSAIDAINVKKGGAFTMPTDPIYEGYVFVGWFLDPACEAEYNYNGTLNVDTTLYAGWIADTNEVV